MEDGVVPGDAVEGERPARERPRAEAGCRRPAREAMPAEESPAAPCDSQVRGGPWHARPGGTPVADAAAAPRRRHHLACGMVGWEMALLVKKGTVDDGPSFFSRFLSFSPRYDVRTFSSFT